MSPSTSHTFRHITVRTHRSSENLARNEQLAWHFAVLAKQAPKPSTQVLDMVENRIVDNAAVALASLNRTPVIAARDQALCHPPSKNGAGATIFGLDSKTRVSPEWAAWANGVAVRELDFHDTFLAADYSHPGDNIPSILAVAQHLGISGDRVVRAIAVAYEVQVALVKGMCLHEHKIDHIAHLAPAAAAGIGALLDLEPEITYHAIGQALHTSTATRQSRKGEISSWKAFAPAFAGKIAVEAVDRAMRGEGSPSPIWEGEDGVIAWLLGGPEARYDIEIPAPGQPCEAILETYTKEHSAEYQAQALIDLATKMATEHPEVADPQNVESIVIATSHHTHFVIGSGSGDPQKYDPHSSRETLDHSIPYIFAVALQDRTWHHVDSYAPERAQRSDTVDLWKKITTSEDPRWTERYHAVDPAVKAFGGRVTIALTNGAVISDELAVANAHPLGASPFSSDDYDHKFRTLASSILSTDELEHFLEAARRVEQLTGADLYQLCPVATNTPDVGKEGIF